MILVGTLTNSLQYQVHNRHIYFGRSGMATGGAELMEEKKRKAILAARAALRALPKEDLKSFTYSTAAASVILNVDAGTLSDDRDSRVIALKQKLDIHPLSCQSIHFLDTQPKAKYPAIELLNFLKRHEYAISLYPNLQKDASMYPPEIAPRVLMGFQSWLVQSDPDELWPFCIQASGRPLDLIAAMQVDQTTEVVEWLTIRKFGKRAADAASQDFHLRQSNDIETGLHDGCLQAEPVEVDRWERPGGPI